MKKYDFIAFDLDGTLTDPKNGLVLGFIYALDRMGVRKEARGDLCRFIGPPLYECWQSEFGFTPEESRRAIDIFREYYDVYGWCDNKVYPGIEKMLAELKSSGKTLALATSKPEETAKKVLKLFSLDKYFDFIAGALSGTERHTKSEVIDYCLENLGSPDKSICILVGDRMYDAEGAILSGIDSLGVLWGHGTEQEIMSSGFTLTAQTPDEVVNILK